MARSAPSYAVGKASWINRQPYEQTSSCSCGANKQNGAQFEWKCTECCKKSCNVCGDASACHHCGCTEKDWTAAIV